MVSVFVHGTSIHCMVQLFSALYQCPVHGISDQCMVPVSHAWYRCPLHDTCVQCMVPVFSELYQCSVHGTGVQCMVPVCRTLYQFTLLYTSAQCMDQCAVHCTSPQWEKCWRDVLVPINTSAELLLDVLVPIYTSAELLLHLSILVQSHCCTYLYQCRVTALTSTHLQCSSPACAILQLPVMLFLHINQALNHDQCITTRTRLDLV